MSNEIIVNGVDVSGCEKQGETVAGITCGNGERIRLANEIITKHKLCKDNPNCVYKQLQPFTEEASTAKIGNVTYEYFYEAYNYMGSAVSNCLNNQGNATSCLNEKVNLFNKFLKEQ